MGQKNLGEMPLAVKRAYAYARVAQGCGLVAEVETEIVPATFYTSGEVMIPARIVATLKARDEYMGFWGDSFAGSWTSVKPGQGRNATTRFSYGLRFRPLAATKKFSTERDFVSWLTIDSYRREDPAKYGILPEADRITVPEWTAESWDR